MIGFTVGQEETFYAAIKKYGEEKQLDMVVEELAELIQATQKYKRNATSATINHVIEEIADVEIMIQQFKLILGIYDIDTAIQAQVDNKVYRLEDRLNGK